jgi:hypothetical protein
LKADTSKAWGREGREANFLVAHTMGNFPLHVCCPVLQLTSLSPSVQSPGFLLHVSETFQLQLPQKCFILRKTGGGVPEEHRQWMERTSKKYSKYRISHLCLLFFVFLYDLSSSSCFDPLLPKPKYITDTDYRAFLQKTMEQST